VTVVCWWWCSGSKETSSTVNGTRVYGISKGMIQRAVVKFDEPPPKQPMTVCFHFPSTFLTHRYVLDINGSCSSNMWRSGEMKRKGRKRTKRTRTKIRRNNRKKINRITRTRKEKQENQRKNRKTRKNKKDKKHNKDKNKKMRTKRWRRRWWRYVLDMVRQQLKAVEGARVKTIQFVDRNTIHGTRVWACINGFV